MLWTEWCNNFVSSNLWSNPGLKRKEKDDRKGLILCEALIKEILVRNMTTNIYVEDRSTLRKLESKKEEILKEPKNFRG